MPHVLMSSRDRRFIDRHSARATALRGNFRPQTRDTGLRGAVSYLQDSGPRFRVCLRGLRLDSSETAGGCLLCDMSYIYMYRQIFPDRGGNIKHGQTMTRCS